MPYLSKRDTSNLEDRWIFYSPTSPSWRLFLTGPPRVGTEVFKNSRPDGEALVVYEVTDEDARFLIDTFTDEADEADESDLLDWLRTHYDDEGTIGQALDTCIDVIDGFDLRQTNTILCALLAHFGVEK